MNALTFIIYRDRKTEWRWRAKRSGRIVAEGGEGYKRRAALMRALRNLFRAIENQQWEIE